MQYMTNTQAVDRIEAALRATSTCHCGAPMTPVAHGDAIWLECSRHEEPKGLVRRIANLGFAQTHRSELVIDEGWLAAA